LMEIQQLLVESVIASITESSKLHVFAKTTTEICNSQQVIDALRVECATHTTDLYIDKEQSVSPLSIAEVSELDSSQRNLITRERELFHKRLNIFEYTSFALQPHKSRIYPIEDIIEADLFSVPSYDFLDAKHNADDVIQECIEQVNQRNLQSAIECLQDTLALHESNLTMKISIIHDGLDKLLTDFQKQLHQNREQFSTCHNSIALLDLSTDISYQNLKKKKMESIRNFFTESNLFTSKIKHIQDQSIKWVENKWEQIYMQYVNNPTTRFRIQREMRKVDKQMDKLCETMYKNFLQSSLHSGKDAHLHSLEEMKVSIFQWKLKMVSVSEDWVSTMLDSKDASFCSYLEDLHKQLFDLERMNQSLNIYKQKVEHLCRTMSLNVIQKQRNLQSNSLDALADTLAVSQRFYSQNHKTFFENSIKDTHSLLLDSDIDVVDEEEHELKLKKTSMKGSPLMGTRLHSLGILAELSLDEIQVIMLDLVQYL